MVSAVSDRIYSQLVAFIKLAVAIRRPLVVIYGHQIAAKLASSGEFTKPPRTTARPHGVPAENWW